MPIRDVLVRRFSVISSRPFADVVGRLTATIGRPDLTAFRAALATAATVDDPEDVVHAAIGSSELMEFVRFDGRADRGSTRDCCAMTDPRAPVVP